MIEYRVGIGFDVHKFITDKIDNNYIILGGIKIQHNKSVKAHSDGDVLIHSLVDAILGSLALGDIGDYFPDNNKKWENANSQIFLDKALELLKDKNAELVNIDIIVICEAPKITPHKTKIKENLANILNLSLDSINIKATTTEKLGFLGREEGVACQSVVNVRKFYCCKNTIKTDNRKFYHRKNTKN